MSRDVVALACADGTRRSDSCAAGEEGTSDTGAESGCLTTGSAAAAAAAEATSGATTGVVSESMELCAGAAKPLNGTAELLVRTGGPLRESHVTAPEAPDVPGAVGAVLIEQVRTTMTRTLSVAERFCASAVGTPAAINRNATARARYFISRAER